MVDLAEESVMPLKLTQTRRPSQGAAKFDWILQCFLQACANRPALVEDPFHRFAGGRGYTTNTVQIH